MTQEIIRANGEYEKLDSWFKQSKQTMLICGNSIEAQPINTYLTELPMRLSLKITRFSDFTPNPTYESVVGGVKLFRQEHCDSIVAIGGGSAVDVAKCIKLYSNMDGDGINGSFLKQEIKTNMIPFLAIPTTAGTGSEATKFAVIYYNNEKQSITHDNCIPSTVILDASLLKTLSVYQRKATMCDALCHAIESFWSVNSTDESKGYSGKALRDIMKHMDGYLHNTDEGNLGMLIAANMAGKAINITQTTAGHAMCYKITSLFNVAHGHAAILCDRVLYPWIIENIDKCVDFRGQKYLRATLNEIGLCLGCEDVVEGAKKLRYLFEELELEIPIATAEQFRELQISVNPERLKNHPIRLTQENIDKIYHKILRKTNED